MLHGVAMPGRVVHPHSWGCQVIGAVVRSNSGPMLERVLMQRGEQIEILFCSHPKSFHLEEKDAVVLSLYQPFQETRRQSRQG